MKKLIVILIISVAASYPLLTYGNIFKDAVHWVKKEGKKALHWSKDAVDDVEKKFKQYGESAVKAVENIGEDVWNRLKDFNSCIYVVQFGAEYASAEAAYESAKAATLTLGPAAAKLGELGSDAINKGVNIKRIAFKAKPAAAFEKDGKAIDFEIQGTVFGKDIDTDVEVDFEQIKSAASFAKQILNKVF